MQCLSFRLFTLFLVAFGNLIEAKFEYDTCDSPAGQLIGVDIPGCDQSPCELERGKNSTIIMQFKSKSKITTGHVHVAAVVFHVPISVPSGYVDPVLCHNVSPSCPISSPSDMITYEFHLFIQKIFPDSEVELKWELQDDKEVNVACAKFEVQVV